jgi:long-chain acyl-CoA synthetase
VRPGYVGQPILKTWDGKPFLKLAEDGEILVRGPNVMPGYWKQEQATREAFDEEGYFRTGDVGKLDPQGRVKITDRKKEIIVTSGGKNVAPQPIENLLREDIYIEQAVVVGDHRSHLAALVVPHFPALRAWCGRKSLVFRDDAEMVAHPKVVAKLMTRVNRVNAQLPAYARVRRIALLAQELTTASGLLTPTLKLKRRAVNEAFKEVIEGLYASGQAAGRDR